MEIIPEMGLCVNMLQGSGLFIKVVDTKGSRVGCNGSSSEGNHSCKRYPSCKSVKGLIFKWDLKVISIDCVIPVKGIIPIKGLSGHVMKAYVDICEGILMIGVCVSLHTVAYSGLNLEISIILTGARSELQGFGLINQNHPPGLTSRVKFNEFAMCFEIKIPKMCLPNPCFQHMACRPCLSTVIFKNYRLSHRYLK